MKHIIILSFFITCLTSVTLAQNNNSPYSIIGIGDIENSSFDRSSGMGHAGLARSSNRYLYQGNPASLSAVDEHFFYFEASGRFKSVNYSGKPITDITQSQSSDLQFKRVSLAIKVRPRWAVGAGIQPFSTANYSFSSVKAVQGSSFSANAYYDGTGSTNLAYITNSVAISKHLSIGLQASYLFGQLQETENFAQEVTDSVLSTTRNIFISKPLFKLGVQYQTKLNSKWNVALGATVSNKTKLRADYSLLVKDGNTVLLKDEYYKTNYFILPVMLAGGIAATLRNAYTFAADYSYQGWSDVNYRGLGYSLVNSSRVSLGMEYAKNVYFRNQAYERYFLQAGVFYGDSYLKLNRIQLKDYGITIGAGTQVRNSGLGFHGGIELGMRGTTNNGLIKENYMQVNFTISYREFWFTKMKKYD